MLNPAQPLFREARYLLAEEPDLHRAADRGEVTLVDLQRLYHGT